MKNRTAATRGRTNRAKGANAERELAALLNGATIRGRTLTARRVPNVGAMVGGSWGGDLLIGEMCEPPPDGVVNFVCCSNQPGPCLHKGEERIEVKRRANGEGFALLNRWVADSYALVLRQDRGEWLFVIRLKDLVEMKNE